MLAYGGDAYSGYVTQHYEGADGWGAWGGQQAWGSARYNHVVDPQVHCDCTQWDFSGQGWGSSVPQARVAPELGLHEAAPAPNLGAELLTQLQLAELKRLIDRDAKALRASSVGESVEKETDLSVDGKMRVKDVPGGSTDCGDRHGNDGDDKKNRPKASAAARSTATSSSSAITVDSTRTLATASSPSAPARTTAAVDSKMAGAASPTRSMDGTGVAPVEQSDASTNDGSGRPHPPGLDAPEEKRCIVLAEFTPESRKYGELLVKVGEEIFVSGELLDGWIFGVKRGDEPDEGWLPASALGFAEVETEKASQEVEDKQQQQAGKASSHHGSKPWHHHGNWWSRQRHLKPEKDTQDPVTTGDRRPGRKGQGRRVTAPSPQEAKVPNPRTTWATVAANANSVPAASGRSPASVGRGGNASGRGRGSKGFGESAGSAASHGKGSNYAKGQPSFTERQSRPSERQPRAVERQPRIPERQPRLPERQPRERLARERPALTSLLDRLNRPLTVKQLTPNVDVKR